MSGTPTTGGATPDPTGRPAGGPDPQPDHGPASDPSDGSAARAAATPGPEPGDGSADRPAARPGPHPTDGSADRPAAGKGPGSGGAPARRRLSDRGLVGLAAAGVVLVLLAGGVGVRAAAGSSGAADPPPATAQVAGPDPTRPAPATASRKPDGSWGPVAGQSPVAAPTDRATAGIVPTGIRIPAIGVDATELIPLGILPGSGELEAPVDYGDTGWYAAGPVPGEPGPAVVAAHVDSRDGPAVFFRLKELRPGDAVYVPRSDGETVEFTVTGVERYPKDDFPTQKVHGPTPDRALRLITCGGAFDHAKRSYRDNIVVYAVRS